MSPHIRMAGIPDFDRDENEAGVKNLIALRLAKFEFFPHYEDSEAYMIPLLEASMNGSFPIYAAEDGGGIAIHDKGVSFYGNVWAFFRGIKFKVS